MIGQLSKSADGGRPAAGAGSIRVAMRVDHPIARAGLRAILQDQPGIELMDGSDPGSYGRPVPVGAAGADITLAMGELPVLPPVPSGVAGGAARQVWVGAQASEEVLLRAIGTGVRGFISEQGATRELPEAIRVVAGGGVFLSQDYATRLVDWVAGQLPAEPGRLGVAAQALSRREREVLCLLGSGCSNADIARRLVVSETTIRSHVYHILTKLDIPNRTQAAIYGYQFRLSLSAGPRGG